MYNIGNIVKNIRKHIHAKVTRAREVYICLNPASKYFQNILLH